MINVRIQKKHGNETLCFLSRTGHFNKMIRGLTRFFVSRVNLMLLCSIQGDRGLPGRKGSKGSKGIEVKSATQSSHISFLTRHTLLKATILTIDISQAKR